MKRKLGGAIVKRCIVTAMTVMLVSNSVLTVRAEESVQVQDVYKRQPIRSWRSYW